MGQRFRVGVSFGPLADARHPVEDRLAPTSVKKFLPKRYESRFVHAAEQFHQVMAKQGGHEIEGLLEGLLTDLRSQGFPLVREGESWCDFCQGFHCRVCGEEMGTNSHEYEECLARRTENDVAWVGNLIRSKREGDARQVLKRVEQEGRLDAFENLMDLPLAEKAP